MGIPDDANKWLTALHGAVPDTPMSAVAFLFRDWRGRIFQEFRWRPVWHRHLCYWTGDVWMSVASFRTESRVASNAAFVPAAWVDIDPPSILPAGDLQAWQRDTEARLLGYTPQPTMAICSGRGLQAFWIYDKPVALPDDAVAHAAFDRRIRNVNHALASELDGDAVCDLFALHARAGVSEQSKRRVRRIALE